MKKLLLFLIALLFAATNVWADPTPTTTIQTPIQYSCGVYDVNVTVTDFTNVGAISLALNFDPLVVGSPTVTNLTAGLTSNFPSAGQLRVAYWGPGITLANNAILFTLRFTLLPASSGATTAFTWSTVPGECEYAGPDGTPIYVSSFFDLSWQIPVRPVKNIDTGLEYCTIQAAIDANETLDGHTIIVAAGNYPENIIVDKDLTLKGVNFGAPCYTGRIVPESTISGSANAAVTIASDGVTIIGFEITNPSGNYAITATGRNNLLIACNNIHNIGTLPVLSGNTHAIAIVMSNTANIGGVTITDNCFSDIKGGENPALTGAAAKANNGSASAVGVGWSDANFDITDLLIEDNLITNVSACIDIWDNGGKGAYGVIINVGAKVANFGKAMYPVVQYNTISYLDGLWAHGVGLEGETPGAAVHNNDIFNLTDHKNPSDAVAVMVEDNDGAASVLINNNSFTHAYPFTGLGIKNNMALLAALDGTCNWYGTAIAANVAAKISGPVTYIPWTVSSNDNNGAAPGFVPDGGSCSGSPVVIVSAVPTHVLCGSAGSILVTWTGGVANYTVAWSPPGSSTSGISVNSYTIPSLAAGTYNITVTDTYGNSASTSATVLYLPVTNVTDNPDTYYATIQAAINAADPNEEIDVCAGIYPENLTVDKAGLAIHGANFGISAGYTPGVRGAESVIVGQAVVLANGVSFDGLEFDSPVAATTILVKPNLPGLSILFQNNVFDMKNQISAAIYNDGMSSTNFTILNNKFKNQFYTGTYSARVIYAKNTLCTITGNDFSNVELGAYLIGTATDATIVSDNRFNVTSVAVLIGERKGIQIIYNDFVSGNAIYCDRTSNLTITNNSFSGVGYAYYYYLRTPDVGGSGIEMHNNSILSGTSSTGKAVLNYSIQTLNATCNWYGTLVAVNIAAKISGPVTYTPWLTSGVDTDPLTPPGFTPSVACVSCALVLSETHVDVACPLVASGSINLTVEDGVLPYSYSWTGPGGYISNVEDPTGLNIGTYTVIVTAANGCTATLPVTLILIEQPAPVVPDPGSGTVECLSAATPPTLPVVTDACGTPITPVLTSTVDNPDPLTCEGTRIYTYTFTDYQPKATQWVYTYTIDHTIAPVIPPNGSSTVACIASAVPPLSVSLCNPPYPATPWPDWDCMFKTYVNTVLDQQQNIFSNEIMTVNTGVGQSFTPELSGPLTQIDVNVYSKTGTPTFIIEVYAGDGKIGTPLYSSSGYSILSTGWISLTLTGTPPTLVAGTQYTYWLTAYPYNSVQIGLGANPYAGGVSWDECTEPVVTDVCGTVIIPTLTTSGNYNGCQGTKIYTYRYADCSGLYSDWVYTYTISPPVVSMPTAGGSTVSCPSASLVEPVPPTVLDNCGRTLSVSAGVPGTTPTCNGTKTWTFTYTDCALATYTWVYTYTISAPDVTMPAAGGSTVQCVADATLPTPPTVLDNCGRTLSVNAGVPGTDPVCSGPKTWTFTYTDCAGATYNWVYTYTVNDNTAPVINIPVVISRPLPIANLNNIAGNNRSNVAWAEDPNPPDFDGDDFTMPASSSWTINKITVWAVAGNISTYPNIDLSTLFSSISLYGGPAPVAGWGGHGTTYPASPANTLMTGIFVGNATNNPNIVITRVQYAGGLDYEGSTGSMNYIWQIDFNNLNWVVPGGQKMVYGVDCPKISPAGPYWFNHYSNAYEGGVTLDQADGLFTGMTVPAGGNWNVTIWNPIIPGWWDKGSDGNILVYALPNITVHMNSGCTYVGSIGTVTATDNCTAIGGIEITNNAPVNFPEGPTVVIWTAEDDCDNIATCSQVITVVRNEFSGTLNYYKQTPSFAPYPEQNMVVTLNSTTLVPSYNASFTTLGDGKYTFSGLCADTYTLSVTTSKAAGGINSTDAAQVNAWGVAGPIYPAIEKVKFFSGDVLGSIPPPPSGPDNWITSGDAGRILQYFIQAGTPAFNTYKWKFWWAGETTITNPTVATPISVAVAADVSKDLYGLCTGDWNGSYTLGKAGTESLTLEYGKTMQVSPGSEFELPLYAGMDMEVGAISLIMNFPSADIEITGVFLSSDPSSPLLYNVSGDELRIGWNTLAPVWLNEGESLITLKMKVNEAAGNGSIYFSLAGDPLNELADGDYEVIGNAVLTIDVVKTSALGFGENSLAENLTLSNHPNPFNGTTTFVYSIPVDGKVILEIYDLLGNKVKVAVDETQSAGTYSLKLDANQLQPGVYTATIKLKNTDTAITRTIKIISK